jgi:hypothetical protein
MNMYLVGRSGGHDCVSLGEDSDLLILGLLHNVTFTSQRSTHRVHYVPHEDGGTEQRKCCVAQPARLVLPIM